MSIFEWSGIKKIRHLTKEYFYPEELQRDPDAFTKQQLNALSDKKSISKLLFYRSHVEFDDGQEFYVQADGRVGVVFRIFPPTYLTGATEKNVINIINSIILEDTTMNMTAFASKDIHKTIDRFLELHSGSAKVKYPEMLQNFAKDMAEKYTLWTKESIAGKNSDLRLRNFIHTISILFPYDADEFIIKQQVNQLSGVLLDYGGYLMKPNELVPMIKEMINPSLDKYPLSTDNVTTLNKQMCKGATIELKDRDGTLHMTDGWKAKVLTTDKYPEQIDLFSFQNLFFSSMREDFQINIPSSFFLSLTIKFRNIEKQKNSVLKKAQWNLGQLSGMPNMVYKKNPRLKDRLEENNEVIHYIEKLGEYPLEAMPVLVIYENDAAKLERWIALIKKSFSMTEGEWILKEINFAQIAYQTFMMSLPLQDSGIIHKNIDVMDKNFKSNNAQIAPLIGDFTGNGDPSLMYFGGTGQVISLDIFNSDNYNINVVGPMGSGKSFWTNDFVSKALAANWQVRFIDFDDSYRKLADAVGGQYIEFSHGNNVCVNFFTNIDTAIRVVNGKEVEKIHEDEIQMMIPIVGYMTGLNLTDIYKDPDSSSSEKIEMTVIAVFIGNAIEKAFERKRFDAGMEDVSNALVDMKAEEANRGNTELATILTRMIIAIQPYADVNGSFYKYFNGANTINFDNSFMVLELKHIAESPMAPVIAMMYLQKANQDAFIGYEKDKTTRRIVGVDEAWRVLPNPLFVKFFENFARRIRKYYGATMMLTQTVAEFNQNPQAAVIFNTADWKIFLPHAKDAVDKAIHDRHLVLTKFEENLFKSVKGRTPHYTEFYVKHKKREFVALLKVTPFAYWLYTTNPADKLALDRIMKQYDLTLQDAVLFMSKRAEGMEDDKILTFFSSRNKADLNIDWKAFFKKVIQEEHITVAEEKIYNTQSKKVEFMEVLPRINHNGVEYKPRDFFVHAKELNYFFDIKTIVFKKAVYLSKEFGNKSVNISLDGIRNEKFKSFLFSLLEKHKKSIFLEIRLDYDSSNFAEIVEFTKEVKSYDANIIFDDVKMDKINFAALVGLHPKFIKISIEELVSNKDNQAFISLLRLMDKDLGISTIATFIETQENYDLATSMGINLMQGYYIEEIF